MSTRQVDSFRYAYLLFLKAKKEHPGLNHQTHDPKPEKYGLTQWEADHHKKQVELEFERGA